MTDIESPAVLNQIELSPPESGNIIDENFMNLEDILVEYIFPWFIIIILSLNVSLFNHINYQLSDKTVLHFDIFLLFLSIIMCLLYFISFYTIKFFFKNKCNIPERVVSCVPYALIIIVCLMHSLFSYLFGVFYKNITN